MAFKKRPLALFYQEQDASKYVAFNKYSLIYAATYLAGCIAEICGHNRASRE
jgi:hypothetical protein